MTLFCNAIYLWYITSISLLPITAPMERVQQQWQPDSIIPHLGFCPRRCMAFFLQFSEFLQGLCPGTDSVQFPLFWQEGNEILICQSHEIRAQHRTGGPSPLSPELKSFVIRGHVSKCGHMLNQQKYYIKTILSVLYKNIKTRTLLCKLIRKH